VRNAETTRICAMRQRHDHGSQRSAIGHYDNAFLTLVVVGAHTETAVSTSLRLLAFFSFPVFCSQKAHVLFTDDPGCSQCATITAKLPDPNTENTNDRGVTVIMIFGETEIGVELEINATKEKHRKDISISFLT
jgi:hypothetical protein